MSLGESRRGHRKVGSVSLGVQTNPSHFGFRRSSHCKKVVCDVIERFHYRAAAAVAFMRGARPGGKAGRAEPARLSTVLLIGSSSRNTLTGRRPGATEGSLAAGRVGDRRDRFARFSPQRGIARTCGSATRQETRRTLLVEVTNELPAVERSRAGYRCCAS
jgi:hypothetical protein